MTMNVQRVLVIRNDKIGDFMLAWPSFAMLKQSLPNCHLTALVPAYTAELAKLCPWIDDILIDPTAQADNASQQQLLQQIKQAKFDAAIHLFSTLYSALLTWKARIPYRLAPATKLAQIFYTQRLKQKRSLSEKAEFEYNLDLIRCFLKRLGQPIVEPQPPYLTFAPKTIAEQKKKLATQLQLESHKKWLMLHPGCGGSAANLSLAQYAQLATALSAQYQCIISAGPSEMDYANQLLSLIKQQGAEAILYDKNDGLIDFTRSIGCIDLFMAGSTGPLHIAAALNIRTVGFFPSKRSSTALRWQPINQQDRHLAVSAPDNMEGEQAMQQIDVADVVAQIESFFK